MSNVALYTSMQESSIDSLVTKHAGMVKRIAYHLSSRLPDSVQMDDLIQAGMLGLLEAARQYDHTQGASFETYAGIRVRGSMLDEVRRSDWTPRSVHRKARMVAEAMRVIENRSGRDARDSEVADHLGISTDEYQKILQDTLVCRTFSLEELTQDGEPLMDECLGDGVTPMDGLTKSRFKAALTDAISGLPERERMVISLYYEEEMNLREIGEVLGVSESRVCQINSQAMLRLRARMGDWLDDHAGK